MLLLSAGNTNDITMAQTFVDAAGPFRRLLADRGHDADHLRERLAERQAEAVIPMTASRKNPIPYDLVAYRQRNTIELVGQAQGLSPRGPRYDKLADNFLAGVLIAAIVSYWAK